MKKTGEILRKAREQKSLSLHEVGIFLKINTRILMAIEEGDMEKLPAKTFLRGFVQSYSKYLKLDTDQVLKIFNDELKPVVEVALPTINAEASETAVETTPPVPEPEESPKEEVVAESKPSKSILIGPGLTSDALKLKTLLISVFGFLLVFVIYFGNNLIRRYQKEAAVNEDVTLIPKAAEDKDSTAEPETVETVEKTPPASPLTTPVVVPSTNSSNVTNLPTMTTGSSGSLVNPTNPIKPTPPTPTVAPTPASAAVVVPAVPPPSPVSAETKPVAPEGKPIEVIVEAKDNVEIEYSSAKSNPQKLILKNEQIHTFKSRSGIRLKISNGGAVNVIVNGQDMGAPGALGQSIQLNYE